MKHIIPILIAFLIATGCSQRQENAASQTPVVLAAGLGKSQEYFRNLYGDPKSEKQITNHAFSLPGYPSTINLTRPFIEQQYQSGNLGATVVYSETTGQAVWVDYRLPNPWTEEQVNTALTVYGSDWKMVRDNIAMGFLMQNLAPHSYISSTGCLAFKTLAPYDLIVYAPQLYADLNEQVAEAERQKQAVPKF